MGRSILAKEAPLASNRGVVRTGLAVLALSILAPLLFAQDVDAGLIDRAEKFRAEVQRHRSDGWLPRFLDVLLGTNRAQSGAEISKALEAIGGSGDLRRAVTKHDNPAALAEVLDVALAEAKVWKPGRVLRGESMTRLYNVLNRGPPEGTFRLEGYEVPERLQTWLFEEQRVNDKIMRFPQMAAIGTLPPELDPMRSPMFWLPHVEIPIEEARVLQADRMKPETLSEIVVKRGGQSYVRWFVHPASTQSASFQAIMKRYPVKVEYLAMPTSSPRSLVAWNPNADGNFIIVKASLDANVGELRRINPLDKGIRAVATTKALDQWYAEHGSGRAPPFMREPMVVFPPGREFGMIVREIPEGFPGSRGTRLVPGSSIVSSRPDGKPPLLVDMIRKSGQPPMDYIGERIIAPFMRQYGEIVLKNGLVGEPHQQNVLLEIGRDGQLTGRMVFRDLDSYKVDVETRVRNGLGVRDFWPYPDPGVVGHGKLAKAREYYNDSYLEYVREDWAFMLNRGLRKYFPEVTEKALHKAYDARFAAEAKKHLGIDVDPRNVDPNEVMKEWRAKAGEGVKPTAGVSQQMLAQEYKRLAFNRRVLSVSGKETPSAKTHEFVLHDGAIEMRRNGRTLGFALLEPRGAKNFYATLPYPRKEPDMRTLDRMYDAIEGGAQDRGSVGRTIRNEAKGAAAFAASYLLKEAIVALETGDPARIKQAAASLGTVEFWGGVAAFTGAAKVAEFGVTKLGAGGLVRHALPLAAGMAAVQLMSGQFSAKDVAIDTAAFLIAGFGVGLVADGMIYPLLFAAGPPGWIAAGVYTVAKMTATLYFGEKLGHWMRGLFSATSDGRRETRDGREGVQQKLEAIDP